VKQLKTEEETIQCDCDDWETGDPSRIRETPEGFVVCTVCGRVVEDVRADCGASHAKSYKQLRMDGFGGSADGCASYVGNHRRQEYWNDYPFGRDILGAEQEGPFTNRTGPTVITEAVSDTKGRYLHRFHWNERISQMCMADPQIPAEDMSCICKEAFSGMHGPPCNFSRASVIVILRSLDLCVYRERWKSLLYYLRSQMFAKKTRMFVPHMQLFVSAEPMETVLQNLFAQYKNTMPMSVLRSKKYKSPAKKLRHNALPFNYTTRIMFEALGVRSFHFELPVVRLASKLQHIDDVMAKMALQTGMPFTRSAIIKRPKRPAQSSQTPSPQIS
jgi:hypothetical protein